MPLTSEYPVPLDPADARILRELRAVREIAHAFLMADLPADVYQFALDRVTPILGASFSLIMQVGDDGELLRPVAQHEWPARLRNWIGALRVRVGDGPSGLAVATRQIVEIPDLFADPSLDGWYAVAQELGFRSIVAAPLIGASGPVGAIAFYFADPTPVSAEQRALVRLVAEQLAATADKATLIDALRRANAALADANAALEHEVRTADAARVARDRFVSTLTRQVHRAIADRESPDSSLAESLDVLRTRVLAAQSIARVASELAAVESGAWTPDVADVDPRAPLLDALQHWRSRCPTATLEHGEPTVLLPAMRTDGPWLTRVLTLLLGQVLQHHTTHDAVHCDVELGRGFVAHRFEWVGRPLADTTQSVTALAETIDAQSYRHASITSLDLALAVALVRRLGGSVQRDEVRPDAQRFGVTLVFPVEESST
jgi:GAF domain-containing protein